MHLRRITHDHSYLTLKCVLYQAAAFYKRVYTLDSALSKEGCVRAQWGGGDIGVLYTVCSTVCAPRLSNGLANNPCGFVIMICHVFR